MPVSMLMSLVFWSSGIAPAIEVDKNPAALDDRATHLAAFDPATMILSWPRRESDPWTVLDADTEEEEDGDPEGFAAVAAWHALPLFGQDLASPIRRDRAIVPLPARSPILRC